VRFLVDTQLPAALAQWLRNHGHQAEHVLEINLAQSKDTPIWRYAGFAQVSNIRQKRTDFLCRNATCAKSQVKMGIRCPNKSFNPEWGCINSKINRSRSNPVQG